MAAQTDRGVPLSTLSPKYLHTNSTSHTWPFSAIAELIDNAYDPDVNAKQFWIDKTVVKGEECLSFMDNGNGLDEETMHKMLSFGYSDKVPIKGVKPIGMYGNGFKSGSMRLGKDAIVFSKSKTASCVGMLSQTYLEQIKANQISVPIVCFEQREKNNVREKHKTSLQDILRYSPFTTQEDLLREISAINSTMSTGKTGTRIIIWNLRRTSTRATEFDFDKDRYDIRIPADVYEAMGGPSQKLDRVTSYMPESFCSLRAYCSILYLKPRTQIIIRGQKVKTQLIAKSLAYVRKDHYNPKFQTKRIPITFGYNTKSKDQYGIMMYHKNRLIKAYERVGCQLKANQKGVGVIGVIECYFLEPTHNKQSFNETDTYRKTMTNLGTKLEEYWNQIRFIKNQEDPNSNTPVEDTLKRPDQNWVQCDDCLKWRKLPDGIDLNKLPDKWHCSTNPDPRFRSCQVPEELEDSDDEQPSYSKTYKQQERENKRIQERERQKFEENQKRLEEQRLANLARQKQPHNRLQATVNHPHTPTTPRSRFNTTPRGGAARAESPSLLADLTPSSNNGLPVISSVCSLSTGQSTPLSRKRPQPAAPKETPKRPKTNGLHRGTLGTSASVDVSPAGSPSMIIDDNNNDDDDGDETDDDLFILETASTPKPKNTGLDLAKVKTEQEQSDTNVGMLLECSDDAAVDDTSDINAAGMGSAAVGTSPSTPAPLPVVTSITTQTEAPKVKEEEADQQGSDHVDVSVGSSQQRVIKQESSEDARSKSEGTLQNGVTPHLNNDEEAGPSSVNPGVKKDSPRQYPDLNEVQEQQDQLLELMQATAQERDSLKERVDKLTCELQSMQSKLQELSAINVKKECSHQASQTDEAEEEKDYKSLFEKAKQKVDELIKDKEILLAGTEAKPSTAPCEEKDIDEIALQVDLLMRKLDQSDQEKEDLRSQLDTLEEERANLKSQCEELRLSLQQQQQQQQRETAEEGSTTPHRATDCAVQTDQAEAGATANSGTDSTSDTTRSLIALRHNVGRLLLSYVPALELDQVNYECNVIDEILEQVLSNEESVAPVGQ